MEQVDLISVIIPVYNVEKYLEKCVNSVVNQTYRKLEIILVDDGSTDASGKMCDKYAQMDSRIVVIHKKNGGLSSARNAGMEIATGQYIGFVDSDDYVDLEMYYELHQKCVQYNLDVVAARFVENYRGKDKAMTTTGEFNIITGREMLEINLLGHEKYLVTNSVWDRLYKTELIKELRFPEGKRYEDICYSTHLFLKADKCGYYDKIFYHYTIRDDSIMGLGAKKRHAVSNDFFEDLLPQLKTQKEILKEDNLNSLADAVQAEICLELFRKYQEVWNVKEQNAQRKRLVEELKKDRKWFCNYSLKKNGIKNCFITILFCYARPLLHSYWKAKEKRQENNETE